MTIVMAKVNCIDLFSDSDADVAPNELRNHYFNIELECSALTTGNRIQLPEGIAIDRTKLLI